MGESLLHIVQRIVSAADPHGIGTAQVIAQCEPTYTEDDVLEAVWQLLVAKAIRLTDDRKLALPFANIKAGRGLSGLFPVGPGDILYNCDGEPVAQVVSASPNWGKAADLSVKALFSRFTSNRDGTSMINTEGVILGPRPQEPCDLDHEAMIEELVAKKIPSAECPGCGLYLHRAITPAERFQTLKGRF